MNYASCLGLTQSVIGLLGLSPSPTGSRIDVRSVSRVGKSDVGTNARRIKAYLTRLK